MTEAHRGKRIKVTSMRAPVNHRPGDREKQCANDAMGEHLQDSARKAEKICCGQAEQDEAHVTNAGVADNEFEITLSQRYSRGVNDAYDSHHGYPVTQKHEAGRKEVHRNPQCTVGT